MRQPIVGYRQDDEGHWVAEMRCGHSQHVRHDPPWQVRPWVTTPEGRASRVGLELECVLCDAVPQAKRAVVIYPEGRGLDVVEHIRSRFDPQARLLRAHLTLMFPFESRLAVPLLESHLASVARGRKPFPIELAQVRESDDYIFLDVARGRAELIALHDALYTGPLAGFRTTVHAYDPHVTLGRLADPVARQAAIHGIRAEALRIETVARTLSVFRIDDADHGEVEFEIALDS